MKRLALVIVLISAMVSTSGLATASPTLTGRSTAHADDWPHCC